MRKSILYVITALVLAVILPATVLADDKAVDFKIKPDDIVMKPGDVVHLKAVYEYPDGSVKDVTGETKWGYSDNGTVTLYESAKLLANQPGSTKILAVCGGKRVSTEVEVKSPGNNEKNKDKKKPENIVISTDKINLEPEETKKVDVELEYTDGSKKDITGVGSWASRDKEVATVRDGEIRAVGSGNTQVIYTTEISGKNVEADIEVRVEKPDPVPEDLKVKPEEINLKPGEEKEIKAEMELSNGDVKDVTQKADWKVLDSSIVSVENGNFKANSPGKTRANVSIEGLRATAKVVVEKVQPQPERLETDKDNITLKPGESENIDASIVYDDVSQEDATDRAEWESGDRNIVDVQNGLITAKNPGGAEVTAKLNEGLKAVVDVKVVEEEKEIKPVELELTPDNIDIKEGQSVKIKAIVEFTNGETKEITGKAEWETNDSDILAVEDGKIDAKSPGKAQVTAEYKELNSVAEVEISKTEKEPQPQGIKLNKDNITLKAGDSTQLRAELKYTDGTQKDVTGNSEWSSKDSDIASVMKGKVTAKEPGTAVITVSTDGFEDSAEVEVNKNGEQKREPVDLEVDPGEAELTLGEIQHFKAELVYSDGTEEDVTEKAKWGYKKNGTITLYEGGKALAKEGGESKIVASYKGKRDTAEVKVEPDQEEQPEDKKPEKKPQEMNVNKNSLTLKPGDTVKLEAKLEYTDGSKEDISNKANWTSTDRDTASADGGTVTAKSPGKTFIDIECKGFTERVQVTVKKDKREVKELSVKQSKIKISKGNTKQVDAVVEYTDGSKETVNDKATWRVNDRNLVTVNSGKITAKNKGTAVVLVEYNGHTDDLLVAVEKEKDVSRVPTLKAATASGSEEFKWEYQDNMYKWKVEIPGDLYDYDKQVYNYIKDFYDKSPSERNRQLQNMSNKLRQLVLANSESGKEKLSTAYVGERYNYNYIKYVAAYLDDYFRDKGYDRFQKAEAVLKYVQSLPYNKGATTKLAAHTMFDGGDCDDKSVLLASILKQMGYDTVFVRYNEASTGSDIGHVNIAINFKEGVVPEDRNYDMRYYEYNDKKYYTAETTNNAGMGQDVGYEPTTFY